MMVKTKGNKKVKKERKKMKERKYKKKLMRSTSEDKKKGRKEKNKGETSGQYKYQVGKNDTAANYVVYGMAWGSKERGRDEVRGYEGERN